MPTRTSGGFNNQQLVKNFDGPRPMYLGAGGAPSASADTTWSINTSQRTVLLKDPLTDEAAADEEGETLGWDANEALKTWIRNIIAESDLEEVSVVGAVAGYTLPLGTEPVRPGKPKRKRKKR